MTLKVEDPHAKLLKTDKSKMEYFLFLSFKLHIKSILILKCNEDWKYMEKKPSLQSDTRIFGYHRRHLLYESMRTATPIGNIFLKDCILYMYKIKCIYPHISRYPPLEIFF